MNLIANIAATLAVLIPAAFGLGLIALAIFAGGPREPEDEIRYLDEWGHEARSPREVRYIVGPPDRVDELRAAYKGPRDPVDVLRQRIAERRRLLENGVNWIPSDELIGLRNIVRATSLRELP